MTTSRTIGFPAGFASSTHEVTADVLPVDGTIPPWLSGTLIRNGPALFDTAKSSLRHWFDGQAMLHRFEVTPDGVGYSNKLLDTPAARSMTDRGRIRYAEFATDPCVSLFGRLFTRFRRRTTTANACVNVLRTGERWLALTETPLAVEFDPETLATVGVVREGGGGPTDGVDGATTTAHPHVMRGSGDIVNMALAFGRHSEYRVFRQPPGGGRRLLAAVRAHRPGYVHSFGITEDHAVLVIPPLVVDPLSLLFSGKPFIDNFRWQPDRGTRVVVVDLHSGGIVTDVTTDAAFLFHHINAQRAGDLLHVDLCRYDDADVVDALRIARLRAGQAVPMAYPHRLTIDLTTGRVNGRPLADVPLELPGIDYGGRNGRPYRYAYGTGATDPTGSRFLDRITKVDVPNGSLSHWTDGGHPGEPVFVPAPNPRDEDDGVLLTVVLDPDQGRSLLVVLDAASMTELARAEAPHVIPFGFHGHFTAEAGQPPTLTEDPT